MFLLDVRYNPENSTITRWIKDGSDCKPEREVYYPRIYVSNKPELLSLIASLPGVKHTHFEEKSIGSFTARTVVTRDEDNLDPPTGWTVMTREPRGA